MHYCLGDGLYTATDSAIDRLHDSRYGFKYKKGHSFETNNVNKIEEISVNVKKMYISIKTFEFLILNDF